uniref:Uncharacterized protein n=1 Tax=Mandrillus leucophaeus TaxID=9568 RepID=A0A2K5XCQ8_MANLE
MGGRWQGMKLACAVGTEHKESQHASCLTMAVRRQFRTWSSCHRVVLSLVVLHVCGSPLFLKLRFTWIWLLRLEPTAEWGWACGPPN